MSVMRSRVENGATEAVEELYRAHSAAIYRYAYAMLGNSSDAEDVTQTTFVNAFRALERGEQPRKAEPWLVTIAHNVVRGRFRQQQARPKEVELDRDVPSAATTDESTPSVDELVRALQRIPETQRAALVMRELEGRPYREIAEVLGTSVSAVETLLFRARRSLGEELTTAAGGDEGAQRKRRRRFGDLALLPLPPHLAAFELAPSAAAAGGSLLGGIAAKAAAAVVAVTVAGGAGYEGVKQIQDRRAPASTAEAAPSTQRSVAAATATPVADLVAPVRPTRSPAATERPDGVGAEEKAAAKAAKDERKAAKAKPAKTKLKAKTKTKTKPATARTQPVKTEPKPARRPVERRPQADRTVLSVTPGRVRSDGPAPPPQAQSDSKRPAEIVVVPQRKRR